MNGNLPKRPIYINGVSCMMNFPSAWRCNELQEILELDVIQDAQKLQDDPALWSKALNTKEKTLQVLKLVLGDSATEEQAEILGKFDLALIFNVFFSEMIKLKVRINGEEERSENTARVPILTAPPDIIQSS